MKKLLLIGPLPIENDVIGGTKVSFQALCDHLRDQDDIETNIVNTSRALANAGRMKRIALNGITFFATHGQVARHTRHSDAVVLNISAGAALKTGWIFNLLVQTILRKPLYIRLFGGDMFAVWEKANPLWKALFSWSMARSDKMFFQTKTLIVQFKSHPKLAHWPTSRDMSERQSPLPQTCRRILFLSQIKRSKGIEDILAASHLMRSDVSFTICGPMFDCQDLAQAPSSPNATFKDPVSSAEVGPLLEQHDLVILPTRRVAEGYPGVLIEAMQMGLPIVASDLPNIAELIVAGKNGFSVPTNRPEDLAKTLDMIAQDPVLFQELQNGAREIGEGYRQTGVMRRILDLILPIEQKRP